MKFNDILARMVKRVCVDKQTCSYKVKLIDSKTYEEYYFSYPILDCIEVDAPMKAITELETLWKGDTL